MMCLHTAKIRETLSGSSWSQIGMNTHEFFADVYDVISVVGLRATGCTGFV